MRLSALAGVLADARRSSGDPSSARPWTPATARRDAPDDGRARAESLTSRPLSSAGSRSSALSDLYDPPSFPTPRSSAVSGAPRLLQRGPSVVDIRGVDNAVEGASAKQLIASPPPRPSTSVSVLGGVGGGGSGGSARRLSLGPSGPSALAAEAATRSNPPSSRELLRNNGNDPLSRHEKRVAPDRTDLIPPDRIGPLSDAAHSALATMKASLDDLTRLLREQARSSDGASTGTGRRTPEVSIAISVAAAARPLPAAADAVASVCASLRKALASEAIPPHSARLSDGRAAVPATASSLRRHSLAASDGGSSRSLSASAGESKDEDATRGRVSREGCPDTSARAPSPSASCEVGMPAPNEPLATLLQTATDGVACAAEAARAVMRSYTAAAAVATASVPSTGGGGVEPSSPPVAHLTLLSAALLTAGAAVRAHALLGPALQASPSLAAPPLDTLLAAATAALAVSKTPANDSAARSCGLLGAVLESLGGLAAVAAATEGGAAGEAAAGARVGSVHLEVLAATPQRGPRRDGSASARGRGGSSGAEAAESTSAAAAASSSLAPSERLLLLSSWPPGVLGSIAAEGGRAGGGSGSGGGGGGPWSESLLALAAALKNFSGDPAAAAALAGQGAVGSLTALLVTVCALASSESSEAGVQPPLSDAHTRGLATLATQVSEGGERQAGEGSLPARLPLPFPPHRVAARDCPAQPSRAAQACPGTLLGGARAPGPCR